MAAPMEAHLAEIERSFVLFTVNVRLTLRTSDKSIIAD
jgi:hypothetical protein